MKKRLMALIAVTGATLVACATNSTHETKTAEAPEPDTAAIDRELANKDDPWEDWSRGNAVSGLLALKHIRENLFSNNLHDPHVGYQSYGAVSCAGAAQIFRTADGTCNDLGRPSVGAAGVAFGRNVPPAFIDKKGKERVMEPNPALVSRELLARDGEKEVPFLNLLAASWIQFMNHDWLSHGKNQEKSPMNVAGAGEAATVELTKANQHPDSAYKKEFGKTTTNEVTHWWDGSQIYGSNQAEQNAVRAGKHGRMATVKVNGREILPKNSALNPADNKQNRGYEVTGFRDNWWVGLSMLHHLFTLEHNAIADMLMKKHVTYDAKTGKYTWKNGKETRILDEKGIDEQVFQTARLVNAAIMAKIHTVEWTPAILPNKTLRTAMFANWYGVLNPQSWNFLRWIPGTNKTDWGTKLGFLTGGIVGGKTNDFGVPFSITEEFTSVYRLHSLLPENINLKKMSHPSKVTSFHFPETRNEKSYAFFEKNDMKDLFYSFGTQKPGQLVLNNIPDFLRKLEIPGHGTMDLAMVDIIRDRERGVPRYNQFRRAIGLKPVKKYSDFFDVDAPRTARQNEILDKLTKVYGRTKDGKDNVEDIDLLVGTLAEEVRPKNFGFGETQFQIFILMASRRLMADRFYTVDYRKEIYTKDGLAWIDKEGTMKKVIARHMPELAPKMKGLTTAFNPWKD